MRRGFFTVIDGLDGIGKGEIERALISCEQREGRDCFDSIAFSRSHKAGLPKLEHFWNPPEVYYDTVVTAEPTYSGIGKVIRLEIVENNGRDYSTEAQVQAYSLDRFVQMRRVVIPALQSGLRVIQSRSMVSTLTYQALKARGEGKNPSIVRKRILIEEGNKLQLEWAPDLLIIPTIKDIDELMQRIEARKITEKDDKSIFDNVEFQKKLKPLYEDPWLRRLFESHGSVVAYLDAGISLQDTREQAAEIYTLVLQSRPLPERYRGPKL